MACATPAHRRCAYGVQGWTDQNDRIYNSLPRNIRHLERDGETGTLVINNDILSFRLRCNHPHRPNDVGGAFMPESYYFSYYNFAPIKLTYIVDNGECTVVGGNRKNPISYNQRKMSVLNLLDSLPDNQPKRVIAFFCHGWSTGFQFGFETDTTVEYNGVQVDDIKALAKSVSRIARPDVKIILYACQTGSSPLEGAEENLRKEQNKTNPNQDNINRYQHQINSLGHLRSQPVGSEGFAFKLRDELTNYCPECRIDAHKTLGHSTRNPFVRRFESPAGSGGQTIVPQGHELWNKWVRTLRDPFGEGSTLVWKFSQMTKDEIHEYLESI
jgi:hypothetical protein